MCAYKIAPFQATTLPLLLEHMGGYPSITSVLKEDVHRVTSLRNLYDTRPRCCVIAFLFHVPIAIDCN